ncbi:hypothetical protein Y032_0042g614 [Ancylostoma ceylanicum]|uniref:Uncharacterized protein n=1 Tax=Ancylostoma ceylanicum TaxID=53326 RepID=A0A016UF50_9BILA|nr:hypothetical protein Y032_0042g614 [Ancylostoma ceylanicum]
MKVFLLAALCCICYGAPLPVPLEEEFNLPGFNAKQENHGEDFWCFHLKSFLREKIKRGKLASSLENIEITQGERVDITQTYPSLTKASTPLPWVISIMHGELGYC